MSEQTQTDDFAAIAKPHPAAQDQAAAAATPGDDFASIAKPHPGAADEQSDPLAMPTLHDLSQKAPEQEHEGLYHMKDKDGHSYAIPYSNVQAVPDWENSFSDNKELERYKQDHKEDTDIVSISKVRHNIDKKNIDIKKTGHFANDYLLRPAVNTANAAGRTIIEPVVDYIDNQGMSREEKEKQGQAEWEGSVFGKAEKRDKEGAPPATAKENLKDAAQIAGDMVPIMPVGTQGRQMAHDFTHGHKMDVATDLAGLGVVAGVTHGLAKGIEGASDGVRGSLQRVAGIGESSARKAAIEHAKAATDAAKKHLDETQDALHKTKGAELEHQRAVKQAREDAANANREAERKHAEAVQQALHDTEGSEMQHEAAKRKADLDAAEANRKATQEHLDATQKALHETRGKELAADTARSQADADAADKNHSAAREHMDATQKALENDRRINSLSRRSMRLKDQIYPRLRVIQNAAKDYFNSQYNELSSLIGKRQASLSELGEYLESAKRQIQGSNPNIAIFNDIEKRLKGEIASGEPPENWHEMAPDEQAAWRKAKSAEGNGITYEDLRGYDRELRKLASGPGTPADVKMAAGVLRDGLNEMQGELAKEAGVRAQNLHSKLKNEYRDYAQTMLDKGSPVAKMMNARDADAALSVFEKMEPFERRAAQDLLEGQGEHANWLRRTDRAALGEEGNIKTPAEKQAEELVTTAGKAVEKAKANLENAAPGAEDGAQKSLDRAEEELERAKKRVANARPGFSRKQRNMNKYREHTAELVRKHVAVLRERGALERENVQVPDRPPVIEPKSVKPEARAEVPNRPEEIAPKPVTPPERAPIPDRPEEVEPKPVASPDRTAPPDRPTEDRPFDEKDLTEANRKVYDTAIERLRKRGTYVVGAGVTAMTGGLIYAIAKMNLGYAVQDLLGGSVAMAVSFSALNKIADLMDIPAVRDFVSKPSEKQIASLNKLPADQKAHLAEGLKRIRVVAEKKGVKTSPLLTGFIVANAANATQSKDRVDAK